MLIALVILAALATVIYVERRRYRVRRRWETERKRLEAYDEHSAAAALYPERRP